MDLVTDSRAAVKGSEVVNRIREAADQTEMTDRRQAESGVFDQPTKVAVRSRAAANDESVCCLFCTNPVFRVPGASKNPSIGIYFGSYKLGVE